MEQLREFMAELKLENLSKDRLENLHTSITNLNNEYELELSDIEKEEARYFGDVRSIEGTVGELLGQTHEKKTDVAIKREWAVTEKGQREIELKHALKVTGKLLQSCKTRLFAIY